MSDDATTPVLLAGARTPFGRFLGALSSLSAPELGAVAVRAALERAGITPDDVDQVLLGQVVQAGAGQGPARQAAVAAGIGWAVALTDAFSHASTGADTEAPLAALGISREEQDEVAARWHERAGAARAAGLLAQEIASLAFARERGLTPLARIGASGQVAGPDTTLHSQPSRTIGAALRRAGLPADGADGLDVVEVNEAFATVAIQSARDLGLPTTALNAEGGAIALGHPVGASGARLVLHVAHALRRRGGGTGVAAPCGGGGQGEALLLHAG